MSTTSKPIDPTLISLTSNSVCVSNVPLFSFGIAISFQEPT